MSVVQNDWNPLNESPEAAEAARRADADYERKGEIADFNTGAESIAQALGGIGAMDPESGKETADKATHQEALEEQGENPEDILSQLSSLDGGSGSGAPEAQSDSMNPGSTMNELQESTDYIVSCEYAPLVLEFQENGYLSLIQSEELISRGLNSRNYHEVIQKCELTPEQKQELTASIDYFNNPENIEKSGDLLLKEFPEVFGNYMSQEGNNGVTWESGASKDAFNNLASNFIGQGSRENQEQQMEFALKMSIAALEERASIGLSPDVQESYREAIDKAVHSSSLETGFEGLVKATEIVNTAIGGVVGKGKQSIAYREAVLANIENAGFTERFRQIQLDLQNAQQENNQARIDGINLQIQELAALIQVETGDLQQLAGGEIDILGDNTGENTRES